MRLISGLMLAAACAGALTSAAVAAPATAGPAVAPAVARPPAAGRAAAGRAASAGRTVRLRTTVRLASSVPGALRYTVTVRPIGGPAAGTYVLLAARGPAAWAGPPANCAPGGGTSGAAPAGPLLLRCDLGELRTPRTLRVAARVDGTGPARVPVRATAGAANAARLSSASLLAIRRPAAASARAAWTALPGSARFASAALPGSARFAPAAPPGALAPPGTRAAGRRTSRALAPSGATSDEPGSSAAPSVSAPAPSASNVPAVSSAGPARAGSAAPSTDPSTDPSSDPSSARAAPAPGAAPGTASAAPSAPTAPSKVAAPSAAAVPSGESPSLLPDQVGAAAGDRRAARGSRLRAGPRPARRTPASSAGTGTAGASVTPAAPTAVPAAGPDLTSAAVAPAVPVPGGPPAGPPGGPGLPDPAGAAGRGALAGAAGPMPAGSTSALSLPQLAPGRPGASPGTTELTTVGPEASLQDGRRSLTTVLGTAVVGEAVLLWLVAGWAIFRRGRGPAGAMPPGRRVVGAEATIRTRRPHAGARTVSGAIVAGVPAPPDLAIPAPPGRRSVFLRDRLHRMFRRRSRPAG